MESQEFAPSDRELLLRVVKDCQNSKLQGTQGSWKEYLKSQTPSLSKTDPTTHSWQVLARPWAALLAVPHIPEVALFADTCWFSSHLDQATGGVAVGTAQGLGAASATGSHSA